LGSGLLMIAGCDSGTESTGISSFVLN
jgi:hypothetical protein